MSLSVPVLQGPFPDAKALRDAIVQHGVVVVTDVFSPAEVRRPLDAWCAVVQAALQEHDHPLASSTDPDVLHDALKAVDPEAAEVALGLGRDLPATLHLMSDPRLCALMTAGMGSPHHQLAFDHCLMRVDRPHSDTTNFGWHQDYTYNVLSQDALTFWIPLVPITAEMGALSVVPASHGRVLPARVKPEARRFDPNRLLLDVTPDEVAHWEAERVELVPVLPGMVVLFSCTLLHRSGANRSATSRFVVNGRYGNFLDKALIRRRWYTARTKYPFYFAQAHPDLVSDT